MRDTRHFAWAWTEWRICLAGALRSSAARVSQCANLSSDRRGTRSAAPLLVFVHTSSNAADGELLANFSIRREAVVSTSLLPIVRCERLRLG